jgi:hypothetical protein
MTPISSDRGIIFTAARFLEHSRGALENLNYGCAYPL